MKKLIFIFVAIFALCSCSNDNKHMYLVTIDAPTTYYVMGMKQTSKAKAEFKDLGILKDSVTTFIDNRNKKEMEFSEELLSNYYQSLNKKYKDDTEYTIGETERAAYKELIGRTVILIIVPESLVSDPSLDDLIKYYKGTNPEIESYCIYDGSSTLAEIEINEEYKRINKEYCY